MVFPVFHIPKNALSIWKKTAFSCLFGVGLVFGNPSLSAAQPEVTGLRVGPSEGATRFVLELTEAPNYSVLLLADPFRVVIDLPELKWDSPGSSASGLVEGLRYGLFKPGTSRIVLDVKGPVQVKGSFILPPSSASKQHRLVLDLVSISRDAFVAGRVGDQSAGTQSVAASTIPQPAVPIIADRKPRSDGKRVIAIDPGHGGVDPGALGTSGAYEKDITLALAKQLKQTLTATGRYHVIMTREKDVFIALRERVEIARRAEAELFISLHADSMGRGTVRGASVYTLSETSSDKEAEELAARENKADVIAGVDLSDKDPILSGILIDLSQRAAKNEGKQFAVMTAESLSAVTPMLDPAHRSAGFRVLKAPDIPSILVESGFMTNQKDEKLLRSKSHRIKLATALLKSVDRYFAEVNRLSRL